MSQIKPNYWTIPNGRVSPTVLSIPRSTANSRPLFPVHVDQEVVAKLAELDMMVADLERANSRVVTVERRNVRISCMVSPKGLDNNLNLHL